LIPALALSCGPAHARVVTPNTKTASDLQMDIVLAPYLANLVPSDHEKYEFAKVPASTPDMIQSTGCKAMICINKKALPHHPNIINSLKKLKFDGRKVLPPRNAVTER